MPTRDDIRNVAIIAHVDHGKTTLVDAMLLQSGAYTEHQQEEGAVQDRVMDSMDLEREKGITILAKNTAVRRKDLLINIIDTPGHADFGGEVERGLSMVDGVALLVDASEGPLPQTRFVLRKALQQNKPVILIINKVDRPDARIAEVVDETYELFMDLDATEEQIDFPIIYCQAKTGQASLTRPADGTSPDCADLQPLFDVIKSTIPAPHFTEGMPLQAHVTNLDSSPYLGRLALLRIHNGWIKKGQLVAWCKQDGSVQNIKLTELLGTEALTRVPIEEAGPGDIVAIAGIPDITIGETLADPDDPRPLPLITIDEPNISMTIGINTSPTAGKSGKKLTARQVKDRLDKELVGNVSIRVVDTERPDTWEVQGRGELQLAILVEVMRREQFELTVGKPQVVTRLVGGKIHEPMERLTIDTPSNYQGVLIQLMALRKGRLEQMVDHGTGWTRMEYIVPARGLIGFRTEFLTETRGTGGTSRGTARSAPARRVPWSPTAAAPRPASRWPTCRSAARCSYLPAPRSTRAWSWVRTPGVTTWTSTPPRRRSSPTCGSPPQTSSCRSSRTRSSASSRRWSSAARTSASRSPRPRCASARSSSARASASATVARRPRRPPSPDVCVGGPAAGRHACAGPHVRRGILCAHGHPTVAALG